MHDELLMARIVLNESRSTKDELRRALRIALSIAEQHERRLVEGEPIIAAVEEIVERMLAEKSA